MNNQESAFRFPNALLFIPVTSVIDLSIQAV